MRYATHAAEALRQTLRLALPVVVPAAIFVAAILSAGCFSDRGAATAPAMGGECRVPIDGSAGATVVFVRDFAFHPAQVRVSRGTRVTWVNCDTPGSDAHTSTADARAWDSPLLTAGAAFSRTFDQSGTFPYHCEPHPSMTAAIVVE